MKKKEGAVVIDAWSPTSTEGSWLATSLGAPDGRKRTVPRGLCTLLSVPISTDLLDEDEDVLVDLRPHWIFFAGPLLLTAASIAIVAVVVDQFPEPPVAVPWILVVGVAIPALWLLGRLARWLSTSLVVTNRRIVFRSGVLTRRLVNLRLQRVVDTHSRQGPFERLIGSGRLVLEVEGEEGGLVVEDVRQPAVLQRVISRQLAELDGWGAPYRRDLGSGENMALSGVPAASSSSAPSLVDQLVELDRLRRQGVLSDEEFAVAKAALLRRI